MLAGSGKAASKERKCRAAALHAFIRSYRKTVARRPAQSSERRPPTFTNLVLSEDGNPTAGGLRRGGDRRGRSDRGDGHGRRGDGGRLRFHHRRHVSGGVALI